MALARRQSASFAWDILTSDLKLIAYPLLRIVALFVVLAILWPLIFDISAMQVAHSLGGVANSAIEAAEDPHENSSETNAAPTNRKTPDEGAKDASNLLGHMHFGWLILFVVVNLFLGVFSVGAITAHALASVRGENRAFGYGYAIAFRRSMQLLVWWLITLFVGVILEAVEQSRVVGLIVALLLGMAWSILTFFSIAAIMATGCGPFHAITESKQTIIDSIKKATGSEPGSFRAIRRGVYIGGPIAIINVILVFLLVGLAFFDWRSLSHGGHGISAGAFGAILVVLYINGAFRSAVYAILKATVYVWAEEDKVPEFVDESVFDAVFVTSEPRKSPLTPGLAT